MNRIAEALALLAAAMKDAGYDDSEYGLAMTREAKMKLWWRVAADDPHISVGRPFQNRDKIAGVQIVEFKEKDRG